MSIAFCRLLLGRGVVLLVQIDHAQGVVGHGQNAALGRRNSVAGSALAGSDQPGIDVVDGGLGVLGRLGQTLLAIQIGVARGFG